jgi:hypothetical protein
MAETKQDLAEAAYIAAEAAIEEALRSGARELDLRAQSRGLSGSSHPSVAAAFAGLTRLPPQIAALADLHHLSLDETPISDLSPLAALTSLQYLSLDRTQVSDLSALAALTGLQFLSLDETQVSDLSPLAALTDLQFLSLRETQVSDLSPLATVTGLHTLWLNETKVSDVSSLAALTHLQFLSLRGSQVSDCSPLAALIGLPSLGLDETQVSDLSPLAALIGLRSLGLDETQATDLSPLTALTGLQHLSLKGTQVSDIAPLASLTNLKSLFLNETAVRDLRPILNLKNLSDFTPGVGFRDTPATRDSPALHEISRINNAKDRKEKAFAFLSTLPPWPEPLDPDEPRVEDLLIPTSRLAPLQVLEVDGELRAAIPGDGLDGNVRLLARQAWGALRDYLADLAALKPQIDNQMPTLARAMDRFDSALGQQFEAFNVIALGIHGNRILRLAEAAGESLSDANAAEIAEFASAVALFLGRFPDWRSYRDIDAPDVPDAHRIAEGLLQIGDVIENLLDQDAIAAAIPRQLQELEETVREAPEDKLSARGLLASFGNVLSALAQKALTATARQSRQTVLDVVAETRKLAVKGVAGTLLASAIDILVTKAATLQSLATSFPEWFGWIVPVLRLIGL